MDVNQEQQHQQEEQDVNMEHINAFIYNSDEEVAENLPLFPIPVEEVHQAMGPAPTLDDVCSPCTEAKSSASAQNNNNENKKNALISNNFSISISNMK